LILLAALLAPSATAQNAEGGVRAVGGLATGPADPANTFGGGLYGGLRWGRVVGELALDAGATTTGAPWLLARPRVRFHLTDPARTTLSVVVGGGVTLDPDLTGVVTTGAALDLGDRPVRPRFAVDYGWPIADRPVRMHLGVGLLWRPAPPAPDPIAVVEPPAPPATQIALADAMVWVPRPICEWLPPQRANVSFAENPVPLADVTLIDALLVRDPDADPFAPRPAAPDYGYITVVGWPGDTVTVGEETAAPAADGVTVVQRPPGPAEITLRGGGRVQRWPMVVHSGDVLWIQATEPAPVRSRFASGSAAVGPDARSALQQLVQDAGTYDFTVYGSYSSDGSPAANIALARLRANAVRDALVALGLDAARIQMAEPAPPMPGLTPEDQRAAVVRPILQGVE